MTGVFYLKCAVNIALGCLVDGYREEDRRKVGLTRIHKKNTISHQILENSVYHC